jgi:hypothetical protein
MSAFLTHADIASLRPQWLAVEAVTSEPVSGVKNREFSHNRANNRALGMLTRLSTSYYAAFSKS